jgi:hypothetical protein
MAVSHGNLKSFTIETTRIDVALARNFREKLHVAVDVNTVVSARVVDRRFLLPKFDGVRATRPV